MPGADVTAVRVLMGGEDVSHYVQPVTGVRTSGGSSLDTVTLRFLKDDLLDVPVIADGGDNIEVKVFVVSNGQEKLVHWGHSSITSLSLENGVLPLSCTSRLEHFHFGELLNGMREALPGSSAEFTNEAKLVFNPVIDDKTMANRGTMGSGHYRFVDPESVRSEPAATLHGLGGVNGTPELWNLIEATQYLCDVLNHGETYIKNPLLSNIEGVLDPRRTLLRNHHIPHGLYLPQALDALLHPFGYGWYINLDNGRPEIWLFRRGVGRQKLVALQRPGQRMNQRDSNTPKPRLDINTGSVCNEPTVIGDFRYFEQTFRLYPCWSRDLDSTPEAHTAIGSPQYNSSPSIQRIHRDWILNEDGSYTGVRREITSHYDFKDTFGHDTVPRRRKFLETLTLAADGSPVSDLPGGTVEYSLDGGVTKFPISKLGASGHFLTKECGFRFTGHLPPGQLRQALLSQSSLDDNVRLYVTATVRDDKRLSYTAQRRNTSPQSDIARVQIDLHDRFQYRVRAPGSKYDQTPGTFTYERLDDTEKLQSYAEAIRDSWDMAEMSGSMPIILLGGTDTENAQSGDYQLGDVITEIAGRNISLSGSASSSDSPRYPQITAITYHFDQHMRTLTLQNFRETKLGGFVH